MAGDPASILTRAMSTPIPDDGYTTADLVPHGWAPGGYFCRACGDCGEPYGGDKRCRRCRACAVKSLEEGLANPKPLPVSPAAAEIRKKFALRVQVAETDARLGDKGDRVDGVWSCRPIIEDAISEIERLRRTLDETVAQYQELERI